MEVWEQVLAAGLLGGLLAVERRAFLQAMFSRPLVAGTLTGLVMGDVGAGLFVGLLLELFHLGAAALGAALPDHDTLAATACTAAAVTLGGASGYSTPALWSLAVLLFVGTGRLGRGIDRGLERYMAHLAELAQASAEKGNLQRAMRQNLWGVWPHFVAFGLATALAGVLGHLLSPLLLKLHPGLLRGLAWAYPAMASVAAACAARGSRARAAGTWAGAAAALVGAGAVVFWWWEARP